MHMRVKESNSFHFLFCRSWKFELSGPFSVDLQFLHFFFAFTIKRSLCIRNLDDDGLMKKCT